MSKSTILIRCGWAAIVAALIISRFLGVVDNRFQALAHVVVGGMLGAWALGKSAEQHYLDRVQTRGNRGPAPNFLDVGYYGWAALVLAIAEVIAFLQGLGRIDGR
jgi:hypothetical protein